MSLSGNRAFNRCDTKVVEFKEFVYKDGKSGKTVLSSNPAEDMRVHAGNGAVLHCPKTEDDRVNIESQYSDHDNRLAALGSLRKLAGELICRDCAYSRMTPVEVSVLRAELAEAEAARISAYAGLVKAREELDALNAQYQIEP